MYSGMRPVAPWIKNRFWLDGSPQILTEARHLQFSETWDKETFDTEKYQWNILFACFEIYQQSHYKWYPATTCVCLQ